MALRNLARHILAVAHREKLEITNLQLQKVLFFTMGLAIRQKAENFEFFADLYNEDFERWRYGPVIPDLYFDYNIYGNRPINENGEYNDEFTRFDNLIVRLLNIDVFRLVALSHKMASWADYEQDILSGKWVPPYTLNEIVRDFNE